MNGVTHFIFDPPWIRDVKTGKIFPRLRGNPAWFEVWPLTRGNHFVMGQRSNLSLS